MDLALAIALVVGGMRGNGMCQRRGRESLPVAVRWEVRLFNVSVVFYVPCFLICICLTRPEKSLHFLVKSPDSNLHFLVSPEIALHLITG